MDRGDWHGHHMLSPRSSEKGASAIIIAGSLLLLLGMAAIAIDVGSGFNERRRNQSAADTAVLGGALWFVISDAANPLQDAVDQAKSVAQANTVNTLTQADWDTCSDSGALDVLTTGLVTDGSDCISFNSGFTTMRVRIPDQALDTSFARVVGVTQLNTHAVAEASIQSLGGGSFPSGVLGNTAAGTEFCVKSGTSTSQSCGTSSTGDFQNFQPYFYTELDSSSNPTTKCTSGDQPGPISRAFADGIDHLFGSADGPGLGVRVNGDWCPAAVAGPPLPDRVDSAAGYSNADITRGLVTGGNYDGAYPGRLDRGPYQSSPVVGSPSGDEFEIFDTTIDNRPLWSYIKTTNSGIHGDCTAIRDALPDHPRFATTTYSVAANSLGLTEITSWDEATELMSACLSNQSGPLFDEEDLLKSPRVAAVPEYHQTTPLPSNACCYDIDEFLPIFINAVWTAHSNSWTCSGEVTEVTGEYCRHQAGMTGEIYVAAPGQQRVDSASAFLLKCEHFSDETCEDVQTATGPKRLITDIELTK